MPNAHNVHVPCPGCRLMDYYVIWNEAMGQSWIACQNCGQELLRIQWTPVETPDPTVVI